MKPYIKYVIIKILHKCMSYFNILFYIIKAWSQIVHELILNADQLEKSLKDFADVIEADEILLFEKTTFLVVSHCLKKEHQDLQRFEKISNIIKQFKLSCRYY